jgi:hypothetical protein
LFSGECGKFKGAEVIVTQSDLNGCTLKVEEISCVLKMNFESLRKGSLAFVPNLDV